MSVKYAMCSSLEAYFFASGQKHFVSQTKTLSSFHRCNKSVLFIIKNIYDTRGSAHFNTPKNNQGIFFWGNSVTKGVI